jgi:hypothetical protein
MLRRSAPLLRQALATVVVALCCRTLPTAAEPPDEQPLGEAEAATIAVEAYHYLYPLVTMDVSRRQFTNIEPGRMVGRGPMNTLTHMRAFPAADFREIVRPNFDTLYSSGWLDLTDGPIVVSVPDTQGRFYLLPMMDMWTDVFASPGKRTTGTRAGHFAVVPPGWSGSLPADVQRIDAPTPHVWIIGRTQTNGPGDYAAVHAVQDGYRLTPLSRWGRPPEPVAVTLDPTVDMKTPPLIQVNSMSGERFFTHASALLETNRPHVTDQPIVARMKRLGIEPGRRFDPARASPAVRRALERAPAAGLAAMKAKLPTVAKVVNGWQMNTDTIGVYGNSYLKRAIVAMVGLGANLPEDAIYPLNLADEEGKPLDGANAYQLTFGKEDLPPAEAFWSVTLYDMDGFPVANALGRHARGDRDALRSNTDGSLDLWIAADAPGADRDANWLPAPKGPFNLTMRIYAPRAGALDGTWTPPPVRRVPR